MDDNAVRTLMLGAWLVFVPLGGCAPLFDPIFEAHRRWEWSYPRPVENTAAPSIDATVEVENLVDCRPEGNELPSMIALIPFVPYATSTLQRPPAMRCELVAEAIRGELRAARVFRSVTTGPSAGGDWVLEGQLLATRCTRADIFYGLSVFGCALWVFGLPRSSSENELALRLKLRRRGASQPTWTYDLCVADTDWYTAYSGRVDYRFDALLRAAMPGILAGLREAVLGASSPKRS